MATIFPQRNRELEDLAEERNQQIERLTNYVRLTFQINESHAFAKVPCHAGLLNLAFGNYGNYGGARFYHVFRPISAKSTDILGGVSPQFSLTF